jgi:DNA-binding PadR family transcriptional regulator
MHGYGIAKVIGKIIGPFRQAQWGALYPVLNKLEAEGLITAEEQPDPEDGKSRRIYALTDAGRERFREVLLDTERHQGDYTAVFTHKVPFLHSLDPQEQQHLCRHYAVYAQQHIDHLQRTRRELESSDHPLSAAEREGILSVLDHAIERWGLELRWAERLMATHAIEEAS